MLSLDEFLLVPTPDAWLAMAVSRLDLLLLDHAQCEKKAASTALNLIYRYPQYDDLIYRLSRFAREELRHFEKVLDLMKARGYRYDHLAPGRYAKGLHEQIEKSEPARLIDTLLVCAFIEARSCERFRALLPRLDAELAKFYGGLLAAEERHFTTYLAMAESFALPQGIDVASRITRLAQKEAELIQAPDSVFRFHSGVPEQSVCMVD
jgi:tRNA-(ms[2]io[6]A)-hydroxylase